MKTNAKINDASTQSPALMLHCLMTHLKPAPLAFPPASPMALAALWSSLERGQGAMPEAPALHYEFDWCDNGAQVFFYLGREMVTVCVIAFQVSGDQQEAWQWIHHYAGKQAEAASPGTAWAALSFKSECPELSVRHLIAILDQCAALAPVILAYAALRN